MKNWIMCKKYYLNGVIEMNTEDTKEQLYDSIRPRERWILDCCYFYDYSMDPKLIRAIFLQSQACFNISGLSHSKPG